MIPINIMKKRIKRKCYWSEKCHDDCDACDYYQPLNDKDDIKEYIKQLHERQSEYKEYLSEINDEVKL
jgi:hypothetical protein